MATATATRPAGTTSVTIDDLRHTIRLALAATDSLGSGDPVWDDLVTDMDELEQVLGQAIGQVTTPTPHAASHVLRMRALAVAARRLLRRDVSIIDGSAAHRATELAGVIARAGVTGIVRAPR